MTHYFKHIFKILVVTSFFFALTASNIAVPVQSTQAAADDYTLLEPLPCVQGGDVRCQPGTQKTVVGFKEYVQYAFNLTIALAAVAAVFMIVWGGFQYMTTDSWSGKSEGKARITHAIYGLLLILCSYLILRTIDPRLVEIPATLVTPLTLKYDNALGGLLNELGDDANRSNDRQLREEVKTGTIKVNTMMEDLDRLYQEGQEVERYKALISEKEAEIRKELSSIAGKTDSRYLLIQAQQATFSRLEEVARRQADSEKRYQKGLATLKRISNPPDAEALALLNESHTTALNAFKTRTEQLKAK